MKKWQKVANTATNLRIVDVPTSAVARTELTHQSNLQPQPSIAVAQKPHSGIRIFISYSSQDLTFELAQQFYKELKASGHQPFMAKASIRWGEDWAERIDEELQRCDCFLLLLSSKSADSKWVIEEVKRATKLKNSSKNRNPVILPLYIELPPKFELRYDLGCYLSQIQYRTWREPADTPIILQELLTLLAEEHLSA